MFEFLQTREKKRAFKKALDEIVHETPEPIAFKEPQEVVNKVTPATVGPAIYGGMKNNVRKPETTAIDLKYFKDWRKVDKVKSDNPTFNGPIRPPKKVDDEDDNPPTLEMPMPGGSFIKPAPKTISSIEIAEKFAAKPREKTTDTSLVSFLGSRFKDEPAPVPAPAPAPAPEPKPDTEQNNEIKVEVVDLTNKEDKKPAIVKPKAKRKPRGKGKRRFDADVISSINWK